MDCCHENEGRLLDFLYGLLEPNEVTLLEHHLLECSPCREVLAGVQSHRRLFTRAAQVFDTTPEFKVPTNDTQTPKPATVEPISLPFPARRTRPWLVWTSIAAAAA